MLTESHAKASRNVRLLPYTSTKGMPVIAEKMYRLLTLGLSFGLHVTSIRVGRRRSFDPSSEGGSSILVLGGLSFCNEQVYWGYIGIMENEMETTI